jgi:hypothetical protein
VKNYTVILVLLLAHVIPYSQPAKVDSAGNIIGYYGYKDTIAIATKYRVDSLKNAVAAKQASGNYVLASDTAGQMSGYLRKTGSAATLTNFPTLNQNTTGTSGGLSANIAQSQVTNLVSDLAAKQSSITTGTSAQYLRGDLSLSTFPTIPDSTTFYTKYRSDTSRSNLYTNLSTKLVAGDITGKMNISDSASMLLGYMRKTGSAATLTNFPTLNQNTTGTSAGLSANIAESQVTNLSTDLAAKAPLASPTFTGTVSGITSTMVGLGNVTNESKATMFTSPTFTGTLTIPNNSIDLNTKMTGVLLFANNGGTSANTSATAGTMTVSMTTKIIQITPTNACTFNASGGVTGQVAFFVITTSGTSSFTLTWGTNYRTTGTLATGTATAKIFCVSFLCLNGTTWVEVSRTAAQ